jgi:hypothetical protein
MPADLTAGVIAGELRSRAERSVAHLLSQTALDRMEIVVVDVGSAGPPFEGAEHPRVRYSHRPDMALYCDAQGEILRQARTPVVAFIEDHCYAAPPWAASILEAFENPRVAAVNYTFTVARVDTWMSRSILMAEYGHWMAPHPGGKVRISSSTNVAYRRDLLLKAASRGDPLFEAEFLIHRLLREAGHEIHVAPGALVAHESWTTLVDACLANAANKRVLGARRAEAGGWGPLRRAGWASAMITAPVLFLSRLAWTLRRRPLLWPVFLAGLPVIVAIYCACAAAEAAGYLLGPGRSREEFRDRELAVRRDV